MNRKSHEFIYLGHRIHFNWPLIIIMAWATLVVYAIFTNNDQCENPQTYFSQGDQ